MRERVIGGEQDVLGAFGFREVTRRLGTLADAVSKKARGVGASDGGNKDRASAAQTVDDEVPVRHLGSMRERHVSEYE